MKNSSEEKENPSAFFARVSGKVQGVGFRYSAAREAMRLGVNGWVKNAANGDVEVWAEGSPERLELFHKWLKRGPQFSRVDSVDKTDAVPIGCSDFRIEY